MADRLIENIDEILAQKEEYIIPENIREDVTILGVTGTFKGSEDLEEQLDAQDKVISELQESLKNKTSSGSGYKEIKWVKNIPTNKDNVVHFNTNYIPNYSTKVEFHVLESGTDCYFLGSMKYNAKEDAYFWKNNVFAVGNDGGGIYVGYANNGGGIGSVPTSVDEHIYTLDREKFYIDGELKATMSQSSSYQGKQPIYFFAQNRGGQASLRDVGTLSNASCKLTYLKIWDNDILVHHFVPIQFTGKLTNCKYGMLDKVNDTVHSFSNPLEIIGGEE